MDNAQKAIMIGVGLFITIIVIAAVMLITGIGQDLLNSGTNQLTGISESLRTQMAEQYNGKTFTGAQVKTACSDLLNRNDATIKVAIDATIKTTYSDAKDAVTSNSQKYTAQVLYDESAGTACVNFYSDTTYKRSTFSGNTLS